MIREATLEEIEIILGIRGDEEIFDSWAHIAPKVFYRGDRPYGLIADMPISNGNEIMVAAMARDNGDFTPAMIAWLVRLNRDNDITLITDDREAQPRIRALLGRHGFTFTYDGEDNLYSYRPRQRRQYGNDGSKKR